MDTDYRATQPPLPLVERPRDRSYPIAVLLPVVTMLIFPEDVDSLELESSSDTEQELAHKEISITDFQFPKWQGEYNDIIQHNTCSLDIILAILCLFKKNIIDSYIFTGIHPSETKYHSIMCLINKFDFDKLRDSIAKEMGMATKCIDIMEQ